MNHEEGAERGDDKPHALTQLLNAAYAGDQQAYQTVYDMTYDELRSLATAYMRHVPQTDTLQPTALVNEVYIRIQGRHDLSPANTREFFGIVSRAMKDIIVEQARKHQSQKRGAGWTRIALNVDHLESTPEEIDVSPLELSTLLDQLKSTDPDLDELIRLRFFAGFSLRAIATLWDCPLSQVRQSWDYAKAFLKTRILSQTDLEHTDG